MNALTPCLRQEASSEQNELSEIEAPKKILQRVAARVTKDLSGSMVGHENHANFDSHSDHANHQSS